MSTMSMALTVAMYRRVSSSPIANRFVVLYAMDVESPIELQQQHYYRSMVLLLSPHNYAQSDAMLSDRRIVVDER